METKFNFNSQVCTDRFQSERLLALGLKKETADIRGVEGIEHTPTYAWSLHRLIEMTKLKVTLFLYGVRINHPQWERAFVKHANVWDNLCDCIEWLIKKGYFNKEYLNEEYLNKEE